MTTSLSQLHQTDFQPQKTTVKSHDDGSVYTMFNCILRNLKTINHMTLALLDDYMCVVLM